MAGTARDDDGLLVMTSQPAPRITIKRYVTIALVGLTLAACSRLELAYENADWVGAWRIGDYLELSDEQQDRLRDGLSVYQAFHRQNRLPRINQFLNDVDQLLATPNPDRATVNQLFIEGEAIIKTNVRDVTPLATALLRELNHEQIDTLAATLKQGRQTYVERLSQGREQRVIDRSKDWLGSLDNNQRDTLKQCVAEMPNVVAEWQDWRRETERTLTAMLRDNAPQAEVGDFLHAWMLEDAARSPVLQDYRQTSRNLWRRCTHTIVTGLSAEQRRHARQRLARYRGDLETVAAQ